ncbi:hypothetical protein PoB_000147000 [Plakobranchus ocellatus]|uniref:Uncharacterized protein n=1 Tax=Plakobranchus ocellatus TaxID=259542 RepID=A0AAV3XX40_9GAST|nr:hypothetical protein PoB_000147000 [Plakobranchus ocellatus]
MVEAWPEKGNAYEAHNTQRCQLHKASTTCQNYKLISEARFHAFIPHDSLNATCTKMQDALNCVDQLLLGCNDMARIPYDTQTAVLKAVCTDKREEYLRSAACFSTPYLQEVIGSACISAAANPALLASRPCGLLAFISDCAETAVRVNKANGCSPEDAKLMKRLMQIYLELSVGKMCKIWKEDQSTIRPGIINVGSKANLTTQKPTDKEKPLISNDSSSLMSKSEPRIIKKTQKSASYSRKQQSLVISLGLIVLFIHHLVS